MQGMLSHARADGGNSRVSEGRATPDAGMDLVRPEDEVGRFDRPYMGHIILLRWLITLTYPAIVLGGLIPMHPLALLGSAGWLTVTSVAATWRWHQKGPVPWYDSSYLFLDSFSVTFGVIASGSLIYPIWLIYIMLMIEGSAERTTRFSALFNIWCLGAYFLSAGILYASGWYAPSLGRITVTGAAMLFVGMDLTVTFAGSRRLRAYIRRLAATDALTGLANRRRLFDVLARYDISSGPLAVFVVDVDDFKGWNDHQGHLSGDQLLVRLARVLEQRFPQAIAVSRYGGDEFVVLDRRDADEIAAVSQDVVRDLSGESIEASVGVVVVPYHEPTADAALAAADDCLREAKRLGKAGVVCPEGVLVGPRPRVSSSLAQ